MKKIRNYKLIFGLMFVCSLLSSCATGLTSRQVIMKHWKTQFDETKAYIYFYRKSHIVGSVRGLYVLEDGKRICALNSGTCFIYEVDPGQYTFAAEDKIRAEKYVTIHAKAGEKYFIKAEMKMDVLDVKPILSISSEGEIDFSKLDRVEGLI